MSRQHSLAPSRVGWLAAAVWVITFAPVPAAPAAPPTEDPVPSAASDVRLGPLKDLNGYFPFLVPEDPDQWQRRAEQLRWRLRVALGLWPRPTLASFDPVIHSPRAEDGYTVEKVYFQSLPGLFVTGNLYRPRGGTGPHPGVLCPHGHWSDGRFYDCGPAAIKQQIVDGAERFEDGGRSPMQSRCVQLARMGCVVFHWDMIGYADCQQIPMSVIHRFAKQRPEMNRAEGWGLFSPQAESHVQSAMGLQTINSLAALEFMRRLDDVDPRRIAVTGASGGGTQTFILSALAPQIALSMPAVMVSTAMQGGCTCENASLLRIGTSNVEFAALFAPKPLGLTAADDWTHEMETKGFPELQRLYAMLGVPKQLMLKPLVHFKHNYNYVSRAAMYSWINRHFKLKLPEPIVEQDYHRLSADELTVWDEQHPRPAGGPDFERSLLAAWHRDTQQQLDRLVPSDSASLAVYQQSVGRAIGVLIGRLPPDPKSLSWHSTDERTLGDLSLVEGRLTHRLTPRQAMAAGHFPPTEAAQEHIRLQWLRPKKWNGRTCLIVSPRGKAALWSTPDQLRDELRPLLEQQFQVCGVDLFRQGIGNEPARNRRVDNPRQAAAYTYGYNHSLFAQRVHDLLAVLVFLGTRPEASHTTTVWGRAGAGHWAIAARAVGQSWIDRLAAETGGFRFAHVDRLDDPDFLPGGARYHDLPGMIAVAAPAPLWLSDGDATELPRVVRAAYAAAGGADQATLASPHAALQHEQVVHWLLQSSR